MATLSEKLSTNLDCRVCCEAMISNKSIKGAFQKLRHAQLFVTLRDKGVGEGGRGHNSQTLVRRVVAAGVA